MLNCFYNFSIVINSNKKDVKGCGVRYIRRNKCVINVQSENV